MNLSALKLAHVLLLLSNGSWAESGVIYDAINLIRPGQSSISYRKVSDEIKAGGGLKLRYNKNRAWVGPEDAAPVIKLKDGTYLASDKHHHIMASINAGATLYPIKIIKDFSNLSLTDAYEEAFRQGLIYLEPNESSQDLIGQSIETLPDNPWRWLVDQVRVKVAVTRDHNGKIISARPQGEDFPVWIKIKGEARPFTELGLATLMREQSVPVTFLKPTQEEVEAIRSLFLKSKLSKHPLTDGIIMIDKRLLLSEIPWVDLLNKELACENLLKSSPLPKSQD